MRIAECCGGLQLPRAVINPAEHVYKIADDAKLTRGKSENSAIAACIVLGSRLANDGATRTLYEIGEYMRVPKSDLGRLIPLFEKAVKDYKAKRGSAPVIGDGNTTGTSVDGLLRRYCNYLALEHSVTAVALHVAERASAKANVDGRNPRSIAGGVMYFTCTLMGLQQITVKDLEGVAKVSGSTIKL
jgi:transcription initiation factor TFIIB